MNTYKGVLLHQRRKMGSDDVAPARIVSTKGGKLKGSLPTLTSKMRQSARSLANYKVREIARSSYSRSAQSATRTACPARSSGRGGHGRPLSRDFWSKID